MNNTSFESRTILSLNGIWEVEESVERDKMPTVFGHTAPVPGLLSMAEPAFPDIGKFSSIEFENNKRITASSSGGKVVIPVNEEAAAAVKTNGLPGQERNYFWYRKRFWASAPRTHAAIQVLKAQFGSEVWFNGIRIGSHDCCYTSARYDVSGAIRWNAENEIIIRVGAHPGVLPEGNTYNTDWEKELWFPGIWDDIELLCFDNPAILHVQAAPRISPKEVLIETKLENHEAASVRFKLRHEVRDLPGKSVLGTYEETIELEPWEYLTHRCTIALPDAELWTPETPTLYMLETSTGGDTQKTRFGVREFCFKTATKRAYLNGEPIFLRGSLICLHRFFEDPACKMLPWDDAWLRQLLIEQPKKMHWNILKLCIGMVPRKWLDIADEMGMMFIYEFPIWTLSPMLCPGFEKHYNQDFVRRDMGDWVLDNCNHVSIMWWNTSLETELPWLTQVGTAVRKLDLSNRPWQNSLNPPIDPDDPIEDHPYEYSVNAIPGIPHFDMINLEYQGGFNRAALGAIPSGHTHVITEYGWVWVDRKGEPTLLTKAMYPDLPYPVATPAERIRTASYLVAGITEYWRAFRNYACVIYDFYLTFGNENHYTSDYFANVEKLQFHAPFEDYVGQAFKPVGVYIDFWRRELQKGTTQRFHVMLCNDHTEEVTGELALLYELDGKTYGIAKQPFRLGALGQETLRLDVVLPDVTGQGTLKAIAFYQGETTVSRRWLKLQEDPIQPLWPMESSAPQGQTFLEEA